MKSRKRILVAPLNWGLGHATRCIPIIKALLDYDFEPIIASDGAALYLLQKEFPDLESIELPSYNISYSKNPSFIKFKLLVSYPKLSKAISLERHYTNKLVDSHKLDGIISDNRFGVFSAKIPSVYITHQLRVLSGKTTCISTYWHQKIINQYDECWVPDFNSKNNLSGLLSQNQNIKIPIKFIGPLSRFKKEYREKKYDVLILLSGPEPQRQVLEDRLLQLFIDYPGKIMLVRGVVAESSIAKQNDNFVTVNYLKGEALNKAINESEIILSRSGYTTIMDLAKLGKKAFFIPTPGQFEQEYLAHRLREQMSVPSSNQSEFEVEALKEIDQYAGLSVAFHTTDFKSLFDIFLK